MSMDKLEHEHDLEVLEYCIDKYMTNHDTIAAKYDFLKFLEDRFMQRDDINYYKGMGVRIRDFMRGAYDGRSFMDYN